MNNDVTRTFACRVYDERVQITEKGIGIKCLWDGSCYTSLDKFFNENMQFNLLKERYNRDTTVPIDKELFVIGWGVHCDEAQIIYVLEDRDTNAIYLLGDNCSKYIEIVSYTALYATDRDFSRINELKHMESFTNYSFEERCKIAMELIDFKQSYPKGFCNDFDCFKNYKTGEEIGFDGYELVYEFLKDFAEKSEFQNFDVKNIFEKLIGQDDILLRSNRKR